MQTHSPEQALTNAEAPPRIDTVGQHAAAVANIQSESSDAARASLVDPKRELTPEQSEQIFAVLDSRWSQAQKHYARPEGIDFSAVKKSLEANPAALRSLFRMEETGGEPDIVAVEGSAFVFADCSRKSPVGRRNCAYDEFAEKSFGDKCRGNAVDMAKDFGVELMSQEFYLIMQTLGKFDGNSWSWLKTDERMRSKMRALRGSLINGKLPLIDQHGALDHRETMGWRGVIRVAKVG